MVPPRKRGAVSLLLLAAISCPWNPSCTAFDQSLVIWKILEMSAQHLMPTNGLTMAGHVSGWFVSSYRFSRFVSSSAELRSYHIRIIKTLYWIPQCAVQTRYFFEEPIQTTISTKDFSQPIESSLNPWLWLSHEGLKFDRPIPLEKITGCTKLAESCIPKANSTGSYEFGFLYITLYSQNTWVISFFFDVDKFWTVHTEPYAFLSSFQRFAESKKKPVGDMPSIYNGMILMTQSWLVYKGLFLGERLDQATALRLELKLPNNDEGTPENIFLSVHMPPKRQHETVQPFASSDDSSVLLESGKSYDIVGQLTVHRRKAGRKKRCTDLLSLSSWQVTSAKYRIISKPVINLHSYFSGIEERLGLCSFHDKFESYRVPLSMAWTTPIPRKPLLGWPP